MLQKKICMLGAFAVGKTSLVSRFVKETFSEKYLTTIGVKIDKKLVTVVDNEINLILWDLAGEDAFQKIQTSYLQGCSGYILVADLTRRASFEKVIELQRRVEGLIGDIPFVVAVNKSDLENEKDIDDAYLEELAEEGWDLTHTSAKTGEGVENIFVQLTRKIIGV